MVTGHVDPASGVWIYGEDDVVEDADGNPSFSGLLNLGSDAIRIAFAGLLAASAPNDAAMTVVLNNTVSAFTTALTAKYSLKPRTGTRAQGQDEIWFNAADHGIVGDPTGAIDQSAAIAALLALLPAAGGTVYIGRLTVHGQWILKNNVRLIGQGEKRTILKSFAGSNAPVIKLFDKDQQGVWLQDLTVDGNKGTQTLNVAPTAGSVGGLCFGIFLDSSASTNTTPPVHTVINVVVQNCADDGLCIKGSLGRNYIQNVRADTNNRYGLRIECPDSFVIACNSGQSGSAGIYAAGSNTRWVACNSFFAGRIDPTTGYGWWIRTQNRQSMVLCQAQDNMSHGFYGNAVDGITCIGLVADSNNGSSNTGGGPTGTPNQYACGVFLDNVTGSKFEGVAYNRFNPTNRQVAPVGFRPTSTNTGNELDVRDNGTHAKLMGDGTAAGVPVWGNNRGSSGGRTYGLLAPVSALTPSHALGTLQRKIEVFDSLGVSLGFVPVYSTIS